MSAIFQWKAGWVYTFLLAFSLSTTFAQSLPQGVKKLASVEGITEYQLDNGLRVLLFPDPSKPTMTVNITYLVGSRHEGYGETGMAHLLEHLVFKGTPNHPNIPQELTEHGARPNGTTWYDRTNYFETFSATDENLKWALDLESDRMVNSHIDKKDLDSEFSVVRNEFESGENSPVSVLMERVISSAYLWHNYGKSTIGNRSDIERVPIQNLKAFYKKFYQPDNAVLMVAGQIDEPKTLALVNEYFGKIPKPERVLPNTHTEEPVQDGERRVALSRVGDIKVAMALYHIPSASNADFPAVEVLNRLLTDEPYGRLYKNLVETKRATSVWGMNAPLHDPGFILFTAEVLKDKSLDSAESVLLKSLDSVGTIKPSEEDLDRAKTSILKAWDMTFRNSGSIGLEISEYVASGDWRLAFIYRDGIKKVSADDVKRVAEKYFKPSNRTVGEFIPDKKPARAEIPSSPDVAKLVENYKGDPSMAAGEAFDATPANINSRTDWVENRKGIEMALLHKKTRGKVVNARLNFRFGDVKSLTGKGLAPSFAGALLDKGTSKLTRQQIKDKFDKLSARVSFSGGASQASVSIETVKDSLPAVIKLVGEIMKDPVFDAKEFDKLKQERIAGLESQRSEPDAIAFNTFSRHLSPYQKGDPRYEQTFDEELADINAAKVEEATQFYKDFYGASNAQATIVGDFDEKVVKDLINEEFGKWQSPKPFKRLEDKYLDAKPENKNSETPDKANAFFVAGMNILVQDTDADYPALELGNYMLGGGFLNSRLATRIRQKDGLSYGVGSSVDASPLDKTGSFMTYAIYAPQNREKLEKAFREEIEKVLKDGFTEAEIKAAKSGYLQTRKVTRSQDGSLASMLAEDLYLDRTMEWDAEFEKKIEALTPDAIKAAFNKHIDYDKLTIIKAGDFANAKEGKEVKKEGEPPASIGGGTKE